MKIAFLNIYNGLVERGSEVFVKELAARLYQGHEVWVFQAGQKTNEKYQVITISNIPFYPHQGSEDDNSFSKSWYEFKYQMSVLIFTVKCLPYLFKNKFDWIIPVNGRWQVLLCRIARLLSKSKILITGHAGIGSDDKFNLIAGKPDVFIALTQNAYRWAKEIRPKANIHHVPNGVDLDKFNPHVKPVKINLTRPIVICVSALVAYKRIEKLIDSVKQAGKLSLLLIGSGELESHIKNYGNQALAGKFLHLTKIAHQKMPEYYRACQLFSLPSRESEAFGLVYLEAIACNLPVVAPDTLSRREIIDGAGYFCNIDNLQQYADTLMKAAESGLGNKPRLQAEKFSWDKIYSRYEEILQKYR